MKFKSLLSGIAAMLVAISTVWAFSEELRTENGAYIHPITQVCTPMYAEDCSENEDDPCLETPPGLTSPQQVYKNDGQCITKLFKTL